MKVKEIGNLTANPKYGEKDDIKYCNFGIAINDPFGNEENRICTCFCFRKASGEL